MYVPGKIVALEIAFSEELTAEGNCRSNAENDWENRSNAEANLGNWKPKEIGGRNLKDITETVLQITEKTAKM